MLVRSANIQLKNFSAFVLNKESNEFKREPYEYLLIMLSSINARV
jgi:hypothetical protein